MPNPDTNPQDLLAHTPYITPTTAQRILNIRTAAGLRTIASSQRQKGNEWRVPTNLTNHTFDERTVTYWRELVYAYRDGRRKPAKKPRRRNAGVDPTA